MNPYDLNDFLKRNNLPKSNNNTPIKSPKDDSNQNQMKLLLKNKNLQSQHKEDYIKKKIKIIEENSFSPNYKSVDKEKNVSTSKITKKIAKTSPISTEAKANYPSPDSKREKKIEALLDIIKKKDDEIEKLQRLVKTKSEYIQTIENILKTEKQEKSRNCSQEYEKLEFLRKKNGDIVQKAVDINHKLENLQIPCSKISNIKTCHFEESKDSFEIFELQTKIKTMELNMKNMENEKRELVSLCARLATDSHNYMNAAKNAVKEYKILISNN